MEGKSGENANDAGREKSAYSIKAPFGYRERQNSLASYSSIVCASLEQ